MHEAFPAAVVTEGTGVQREWGAQEITIDVVNAAGT